VKLKPWRNGVNGGTHEAHSKHVIDIGGNVVFDGLPSPVDFTYASGWI
jgi:hypothetical protein